MKTVPFLSSLSLLLVALAGSSSLRAADPAPENTKPFKNVSVEQFDKLRADKDNVVLDVRTKKEFDAGHIPGALNIDWKSADFTKQVSELDRNKTYLVHCAVGGRSASACGLMTAKLQFRNCVNLEQGFKAWEKAGKPIEK